MSNTVTWKRSESHDNRISANNGRDILAKGLLSVAIDKDKPSRWGGWTLRVWTSNDWSHPVKVDNGFTTQLQAKLVAEAIIAASQDVELANFDLATWLSVRYHQFWNDGIHAAWAVEEERAAKRSAKQIERFNMSTLDPHSAEIIRALAAQQRAEVVDRLAADGVRYHSIDAITETHYPEHALRVTCTNASFTGQFVITLPL